jgi:peptidyl-prolyl cis-trans isomerase A (cyclophilin A)/peptidyl-prolyl cis-trans isomerase B (cyclophilin B)
MPCGDNAAFIGRIIMLARLFAVLTLCASAAAHAGNPVVELKTSQGAMTLELYPDKAPETVKNFLGYVRAGHYDGTVFHRVIDGFMIQGGGFDRSLKERPIRAPIQNEAANGLRNEPYTLAMARTADPHSAAAQFFINVANNDFLNFRTADVRGYGYAVFGKVTKGREVADRIAKTATGSVGPFPSDVPLTAVVIEKAKVVGDK